MELVIKLIFVISLIVWGYFRGSRNYKAHIKQLDFEEQQVKDILIFATKYPDQSSSLPLDPILVAGSAVISVDHFRYFLSSLRKFVGGNYSVYEDLTLRARRQAIIRMKQQAQKYNTQMIFNVKYQTTPLSNQQQGEMPQVEVLAYGTAFIPNTGLVKDSIAHYEKIVIPEREQSNYQTFKNKYAQIALISTLLLAVYSVMESFLSVSERVLRYVNGAPWTVFWVLSCLVAILAWRRSSLGKDKLPLSDKIILSILFIPCMTLALYFIALRVNTITASPMKEEVYILQQDMTLKPKNSQLPIIHFDEQHEYWHAQKTGSEIKISLQRGLLFFYQYDAKPLVAKYDKFHEERRNKNKLK